MQNVHWIITGGLALLGILAYVFKAGQWAQERVSRDEKLKELSDRFDRHCEAADKWKTDYRNDLNTVKHTIGTNEARISRLEADRRIVIFGGRRRHEDDDNEG